MEKYLKMKIGINKKLIGFIFSYSSSIVLSQIFIAAYTLCLIWWMNPEEYGVIAANYAVPQMMNFIISLGLNMWLVRTIPTVTFSKALTGSVLRYKLIAGMFWAIGIWLVFPFIQPDIYQKILLAIVIIDVWLDSCFNVLISDFIGHEDVYKASVFLILSRVLRLVSIGIIILLNIRNIEQIVIFRLISTLVIFIVTLFFSKPVFKNVSEYSIFYILHQSIIFNTSEILNIVHLNLDLNLLTWRSGNISSIGNFAIASSLINMIITVPAGVSSLLLPVFINTFRASKNEFYKKMRITFFGFLGIGLLLWASVHFLRLEQIKGLFGYNYQEAIFILLFISPTLFLRTFNQTNIIYLISKGRENKQLLPQFICVLIKFFAGFIVITYYDVSGLIWVIIIVDTLLLIGYSTQVIIDRLHQKSYV